MKTLIGIAAASLCLAPAAPAAASPREYNRGYYDCLAGRYDEDARSHAYRQGCRDAQHEQERGPGGGRPEGWGPEGGGEPGWRPNGERPAEPGWGPNGGRPGWGLNGGGPVGPPNVKGMAPAQVMATMAAFGYRNVGTEVAGAAIYGFYFNPATRACVQVANMYGRAIGAVPIGSNPRCR